MLMVMLTKERVRDLEHRAEELRTIAEYMKDPDCRRTYQQLAGEYEQMAAQRKMIRAQMQ